MAIRFEETLPSQEDFWRLFETTGWNEAYQVGPEELIRSVENSQWILGAYANGRLVGFGRVVADGVIHAMVYDLIVLPEYRNQGIGSRILKRLVQRCLDAGIRDIQLFCAKGQVGFYNERGFEPRPSDAPGMQYTGT